MCCQLFIRTSLVWGIVSAVLQFAKGDPFEDVKNLHCRFFYASRSNPEQLARILYITHEINGNNTSNIYIFKNRKRKETIKFL